MAFDAHKNFATSTVATAPSPAGSGTTLSVAAGEGALFPAAPFNATVWPAGTMPVAATAEIIRVTSKGAGDNWTIVRQTESPGGRSIIVGDYIAATITKKKLDDIEAGTNFPLLSSAGLVDLSAAGAGQIKFPATQNASSNANTLDDYEEGTWTLTLACSTSGTITMSENTGTYLKFGRLVILNGYFSVASVSSPVGAVTINGLPFTAGVGLRYQASMSIAPNGFAAGLTQPWGQVFNGTAAANFYNFASGNIANAASFFQAAADFRLFGAYFTD